MLFILCKDISQVLTCIKPSNSPLQKAIKQRNQCSCLRSLSLDIIRNYIQLHGLAIVIGLEQTILCVGSELDWLRPPGLICGGTCWYENETGTTGQKISCLSYRMFENIVLLNYRLCYLLPYVTTNCVHINFTSVYPTVAQGRVTIHTYTRCAYVHTGF